LKLPKAEVNPDLPLQLLIANIDYDEFKGKLGKFEVIRNVAFDCWYFISYEGIGRIVNGELKVGDEVLYGKPDEPLKKGKISELFVFSNMGREKVERASAGDIVVVAGEWERKWP
jgi:GTP-binding protein